MTRDDVNKLAALYRDLDEVDENLRFISGLGGNAFVPLEFARDRTSIRITVDELRFLLERRRDSLEIILKNLGGEL